MVLLLFSIVIGGLVALGMILSCLSQRKLRFRRIL